MSFPLYFEKGRNELSGRKTNKEGRGRVGSISRRCLALIFREMKGRRRRRQAGGGREGGREGDTEPEYNCTGPGSATLSTEI